MDQNGKPYIIAEIGFNHEGDMRVAKKMIAEAARAGADAVKFQTFRAEDLALPSSPHFKAIRCGELSLEQHVELARAAKVNKVDFLSTPYSEWAVDLLEKVGVKAYKIASMDLTNTELLRYTAKTGKPLIISTGMARLPEILSTVKLLRSVKSGPVTMLHCLSKYPADPADLNLAFMDEIRRVCKCRVGYSDHSVGTFACLAAAILGASVIEKHFTLDTSKAGADHYHSADGAQLKKMIGEIGKALLLIGDVRAVRKRVDREDARLYRRGVYAKVDLPRGTVISMKDLVACRPESQFSPAELGRIVGKKASRAIKGNTPITSNALSR